jgi:hypothetical protein
MDARTFELLSQCATAAEMAFLAELETDGGYVAESLRKDVARYIFERALNNGN